MLAQWFVELLYLHVGSVIASGTLFFVRGCMMLAAIPGYRHIALRRLSQVIDSTLLIAAILLTLVIRQYPFVAGWLTMKVALLVVYIGLGVVALHRGRSYRIRAVSFVLALATFGFIISVAVTHQPLGALAWVAR